jgi:hypothetical protein
MSSMDPASRHQCLEGAPSRPLGDMTWEMGHKKNHSKLLGRHRSPLPVRKLSARIDHAFVFDLAQSKYKP